MKYKIDKDSQYFINNNIIYCSFTIFSSNIVLKTHHRHIRIIPYSKPEVEGSIEGTQNNDKIKGGDGTDKLDGKGGNDRLRGGREGDDKIEDGKGNDEVIGEAGNDEIEGEGGDDK